MSRENDAAEVEKAPPQTPDQNDEIDPISLLTELIMNNRRELDDGTEIEVDHAFTHGEEERLTKAEMKEYQAVKERWIETWATRMADPAKSLAALEKQEQEILQAVKDKDWERLEKLQAMVTDQLAEIGFVLSKKCDELGVKKEMMTA